MVILYGTSAWQYYQTPPVIRDAELPKGGALASQPEGAGAPEPARSSRRTASEATRILSSRLAQNLKGVATPVHCMVDEPSTFRANGIVRYHHMRRFVPKEELVPLGGDLYVTSPELTLVHLAMGRDAARLALLIYEACGTYATPTPTGAARFVFNQLVGNGYLDHVRDLPALREFEDSAGRRVALVDAYGEALPWKPALNARRKPTGLWRRPPLTSVERLSKLADRVRDTRGLPALKRALGVTRDGAASPLEARVLMLCCSDPYLGGEGWPWPAINRRIDFPRPLKTLAGTSYCIADLLWDAQRVDLEVNGEDYHTDEYGFVRSNGRRAALEAMGYTVLDIDYAQAANLKSLDIMLDSFSQKLGIRPKRRTAAFLQRKKKLHAVLFPYGER